jgi:hypothetical protein
MSIPTKTIQLPSGESLSAEEIVTGFLLLARDLAPFPVITQQDAHLACLMMISEVMSFNETEDLI